MKPRIEINLNGLSMWLTFQPYRLARLISQAADKHGKPFLRGMSA